MADALILSAAALGLIAPLLPGWRRVLLVLMLFALVNGVLLYQVHTLLAAEPNPGPAARGFVVLAYLPSAIFLLSCIIRLLFTVVSYARRHIRGRAASPKIHPQA